MENRNNALHYKMYKSGKSIVFAGLATTAALAGLTLANANATTVHAATNAPATEQVATSAANTSAATSAEIASQEAVVNSASANVAQQQNVVSAASAALQSATNVNSASASVASAANAYSAANSDYYAARHAQGVAHKAANDASDSAANVSGVKTAQLTAWWDKSGQSDYNKVMNAKNTAETSLKEAQAQSDAVVNAWNQASDAVDAAVKAGLKSDSNEMNALNAQKSLAWNNMTAVQDAIKTANRQIKAANQMLSDTKDGISLETAKSIMDQLPALKKAAEQAEQAYKDARQATSDAGDIANAKYNAWEAARKANNLPYGTDDPVYTELSSAASSASAEISNDEAAMKALPTADGTQLSQAEGWAKEAQTKLDHTNSELPTFENNVKFFQTKLDEAQKTLNDAQAAYDKNPTALNKQLVNNANGLVGSFKGQLTAAQATLKKAQDAQSKQQEQVNYWNGQVQGVKNSARYAELVNEINTDKAIVQKFNDAKANMKNAAASAEKVAPLKAAYDEAVQVLKAYQNQLAAAQAKLAAMKGETTPSEKPGDNEGNKPGNDDQQQPGDSQGNDDQNQGNGSSVNGGSASTNNGAVNGSTSITVNGNHASAVAGNAVANKVSFVTTAGKHAAATNVEAAKKDSEALPQTGNENSAAVVALGAVSAMFGLGLAAKKREF